MNWLEFFEKFAGPIATVIASLSAAAVAITFGRLQAKIARAQAATVEAQKDIAQANLDIAFDKLKYDLFARRYEIYIAAKQLIETIFNQSPINVADPKIKELRIKVDEARFFFPPDTRAFCEQLPDKTAIL